MPVEKCSILFIINTWHLVTFHTYRLPKNSTYVLMSNAPATKKKITKKNSFASHLCFGCLTIILKIMCAECFNRVFDVTIFTCGDCNIRVFQ